jgi:hypothetical protein
MEAPGQVHSRTQVALDRIDDRSLILIDPRLDLGLSVRDDFPYGNAETLPNARAGDTISFFISGNLTRIGSARLLSAPRRLSWGGGGDDDDDDGVVDRAQRLLDDSSRFARPNMTVGLDAGLRCKKFGCQPRVWRAEFDSVSVSIH